MPYVDPKTVIAPKHRLRDVRVIYDSGAIEGSWSVAELRFDEEEAYGLRWNGDASSKQGTPVAHGNPTWFILPGDLADAVRDKVEVLNRGKEDSLLEGYRQMAADREREAEAEDWTEGLIGDAY